MDKVVEYGLQKDMIFLVLFVLACGGLAWLVKYVLKTSGDREVRYLTVTEKLASELGIVEDIDKKVERIDNRLDILIERKG